MKVRVHWGVGVALVYASFASATVGFVAFAVTNPAALVSTNYYREATHHDRRIEATANGRAVAAGLVIDSDPSGRPVATLHVVPGEHGADVGTVTWYRPSDVSFDRTVPLALDDRGRQRMVIDDLPTGHWRVKVEWERNGRPFYFEQTVMVRP